jgi:hypothetical protein
MNDPVKGCDVYKNIGCAHVDGFLCDYPNCSILKDYRMNERIKELVMKTLGENELGLYTGTELDIENLVELIVRECVQVVNAADDSCEDYYGTIIKEHFGVK